MPVHYEKVGEVAKFTLDNGKLNVLDMGMHEELYQYLSEFLADDSLKVGILTGSEGKSFCAGDDLRSETRPINSIPNWENIICMMQRDKPIIGAVNHWCLGQGFIYLLILTDIRIATPDARFGFPEINYGMGGAGGASRLSRQIPRTLAMYLLMTGEYLNAEQAKNHYLVNEVIKEENLMQRAMDIAAKITRHPLLGIRTEMVATGWGEDQSGKNALDSTGALYKYQRALHLLENADNADIDFAGPVPKEDYIDD
jgi:enoyl-CoA hydratase/carnithine racemase